MISAAFAISWSILSPIAAPWTGMTADLHQDESVYAVRGNAVSRYATAEEARTNAPTVLEVLVDHASFPRGVTGGPCFVNGRVLRVVRGAGLTPRGRIELVVPCVARPRPGDPRRIPEDAFGEGARSLFYFSAQQELLDVEPIDE